EAVGHGHIDILVCPGRLPGGFKLVLRWLGELQHVRVAQDTRALSVGSGNAGARQAYKAAQRRAGDRGCRSIKFLHGVPFLDWLSARFDHAPIAWAVTASRRRL